MNKVEIIKTSRGPIAVELFGATDSENKDVRFKRPVLYFHGFCGCRYEASFADVYARQSGITLIAPDRPGFGDSPFDNERTYSTWATTTKEILDYLNIEKANILAVSGGAPYALACLAHIGDRISKTVIVSGAGEFASMSDLTGMARFPRTILRSMKYSEWIARPIIKMIEKRMRTDVGRSVRELAGTLARCDQKTLLTEHHHSFMSENIRRALGGGAAESAFLELKLMVKPWDFDLSSIQNTVTFIHGEEDHLVPHGVALKSSLRVPNCNLKIIPEEGHFMVLKMAYEVLNELKTLN